MHDLYRRQQTSSKTGKWMCALIEHSLGAASAFPVVYARTAFMHAAEQEGVRVPKTEIIADFDGLRRWVIRAGFPTVLKTNGTSGGDGVRIVKTIEESEGAFRTLQAPPILARAAKRALIDQDKTLVWPSLRRRRRIVNGQGFIAGREATSMIACWEGSVIAALHFEVLSTRYSNGPASVLRLLENPEIASATERVARRLKLSGFYGFDFILESNTGSPYLIEMNPRATQVGHLTLGPGRDLPAALYSAISGEVLREAPCVTEKDTIALFPQEFTRNPASAFLSSAYHDVPWDQPELVRSCLGTLRIASPRKSQQKGVQVFSGARVPHP
ncbi:MAG: ATP-binding protein [Candidatus Acidiferrales bacterium]